MIKVVTPPTEEPVTLDDVKTYLRVDDTYQDAIINALITAAREYCEAYQNRAYVTQTIELTLDHFPHHAQRRYLCDSPFYAPVSTYRYHHRNAIQIPMPPIQKVESITYTDDTGVASTLDLSTCIVDTVSEPGRIVPAAGQTWPIVRLQPINGVCVRYVAGYGMADNVPKSVKQAMMMLITHWFENREAVVTGTISKEIEFAVKALLNMQRVIPT